MLRYKMNYITGNDIINTVYEFYYDNDDLSVSQRLSRLGQEDVFDDLIYSCLLKVVSCISYEVKIYATTLYNLCPTLEHIIASLYGETTIYTSVNYGRLKSLFPPKFDKLNNIQFVIRTTKRKFDIGYALRYINGKNPNYQYMDGDGIVKDLPRGTHLLLV